MKFKLITLDKKEFFVNAESKQALLQDIEFKVKQFADFKEAFNIKLGDVSIHSDSLTIFNTDTDREELALSMLKVEALA